MQFILNVMKLIMNLVGAILGLLFLNIWIGIIVIPIILGVMFLVILPGDKLISLIDINYKIAIYFILFGLILSFYYVKNRGHFYFYLFLGLFTGFLLFEDYYFDSVFILIASMGLVSGYGLYSLGFITFLNNLKDEFGDVFDAFKYHKIPFRWTMIYLLCKRKKLEVYLCAEYDEFDTFGTQSTIITISNSGELSINPIGENSEDERLSLNVINARVTARLSIYPNMSVFITGPNNVPARTVFSLLTFLLKNKVNKVNKVGFISRSSALNLLYINKNDK